MIESLKKMPLVASVIGFIKRTISPNRGFTNSEEYWIKRYQKGGNSGTGSYNNLAEFKGEILNDFVIKNSVQTVIELGSGDGNQLDYLKFPSYIGFDISELIIKKCSEKFQHDSTKQFLLLNQIANHKADLVLSLDVIYHLIEDEIYHHYMTQLFTASTKYVIIYAIDADDESGKYAPHVKPRKFSNWIEKNEPNFILIKHIPNKYPYVQGQGDSTSFADFYIYEKSN